MPWAGCDKEIETGVNQRIPCTLKVCEALRSLMKVDEPVILGGDFNDDFHPIRILNDELGLQDVFEVRMITIYPQLYSNLAQYQYISSPYLNLPLYIPPPNLARPLTYRLQ